MINVNLANAQSSASASASAPAAPSTPSAISPRQAATTAKENQAAPKESAPPASDNKDKVNAKEIAAKMAAASNDFDAGRYDEAARQFQQIVTLDPKNVLAWYSLGLSLDKNNDRIEAKKAYEHVLEIQKKGDIANLASNALANFPLQDCSDCPEMVVIPAGMHILFGDQLEQASVTMPKFAMSKTLVTQGEWKAIMGHNPSYFTKCGNNCPVENVSWNEVQDYLRKLSEKTGTQYRLPSEAEWEYACMGGENTNYCGSDNPDAVSWYSENSGGSTHPVAKKHPNGFGLYDMSGNLWEWTRDCSRGNCASGRVLRGGSWSSSTEYLRAAARGASAASGRGRYNGFRVIRSVQ